MSLNGIKLTTQDIEKYNQQGKIYATKEDMLNGNSVNVNSQYFGDNNSEVYLTDDGKIVEFQSDGSKVYMGWINNKDTINDTNTTKYTYDPSTSQVTYTNSDGSKTVVNKYIKPKEDTNSAAYKAKQITNSINNYVDERKKQPFNITEKDISNSQSIQPISKKTCKLPQSPIGYSKFAKNIPQERIESEEVHTESKLPQSPIGYSKFAKNNSKPNYLGNTLQEKDASEVNYLGSTLQRKSNITSTPNITAGDAMQSVSTVNNTMTSSKPAEQTQTYNTSTDNNHSVIEKIKTSTTNANVSNNLNYNNENNSANSVQQSNLTDVNQFDDAYTTLAKDTLNEVNERRRENGLPDLEWSDELAKAAAVRAKEASQNWSHTRPNGQQYYTVNENVNGENLAFGYNDANSTVEAWMNSPTHRDNLLDKDLKSVGISVVESNDGLKYYAADFGEKKSSDID